LRFLKTLFWIIIAVLVSLFAARNWRDVTISLWGNLEADVKIPLLLAAMFLIALVPTVLVYRARIWRLNNRISVARRESPPIAAEERDSSE
jgi:lipopolysaccharide assembly protein A